MSAVLPIAKALAADKPQSVSTPWPLFREIERRLGWNGFTLDVCADADNAKVALFLDEKADGLVQAWNHLSGRPSRCWVNPPFGNIGPWVDKAIAEVAAGNAELVVMLVPARVSNAWFHRAMAAGARVEWIEGRVRFDPPPGREKYISPFEHSVLLTFSRPLRAAEFR